MFQDLDTIINLIQNYYDIICDKWNDLHKNDRINLKKKTVASIKDDLNIYNYILEYRSIINEENTFLPFIISSLNLKNSSFSTRVKALNSIEYKIDNYFKNHDDGQVPISKCLNDLFGCRITIDENFQTQDIIDYINKHYPQYKCIDSSKNGYVATHIYFAKYKDNSYFQWELQVWSSKYAKSNDESHSTYKQDYTKWESLNKGGG